MYNAWLRLVKGYWRGDWSNFGDFFHRLGSSLLQFRSGQNASFIVRWWRDV